MRLRKFLLLGLMGFFLAATSVAAALTYGSGYYTNLCDSGTAATFYNCDPGCDPITGSCRGDNLGVVKWVCSGKWNQCLESESQWSNLEQMDGTGCGYTVQLSKFDKKCRREDGTWDSSCQLLGYMVWYSGDCRAGIQTTPVPVTVNPTMRPSPTPVPTATPIPTPTNVPDNDKSKLSLSLTVTPTKKPSPTPTMSPADKVCNIKCKQATDCRAGFACVAGACRNPACPTDKTCFCRGEVEATASAITTKSPDTGWEVWTGMVGMVTLGWIGTKLRKVAKGLW